MNYFMWQPPRQVFSDWPSKTVIYMEGAFASNDYSGSVAPLYSWPSMAFLHNQHGNLVMADLSLLSMTRKDYNAVSNSEQFWFPTADQHPYDGAVGVLHLK
jgi:hypothetical protein